jgi:hypothetical protein
MRLSFLLALLSVSSSAWAMGTLNLSFSTSCPDDLLQMDLSSSDGTVPSGIELRLVLYEPYNGLRGIAHTDENGSASIGLARTGEYRIYLYNTTYDHPDYIEFNYTRMCPAPPPKSMNLSISADCENGLVLVNASSGLPVGDVFILGDEWSSMTGPAGTTVLPFDGSDYVFLIAQKKGYMTESGWYGTGCTR